MSAHELEKYLQAWRLKADGEPFATRAAHLLPVRLDGHLNGRPAMIKIAQHIDEQIGGKVMRWWDGDGAARVYACDEDAGVLLMERAMGTGDLLSMALAGDDAAATRIICDTIGRLHAPRPSPPPEQLLPLTHFFESLAPMALHEGGIMAECAAVADELLTSQREHVVLHGFEGLKSIGEKFSLSGVRPMVMNLSLGLLCIMKSDISDSYIM